MKKDSWFLLGLGVLVYYGLSRSAASYPPAGPVQGPAYWGNMIDPTTGMYYNPLADPCYVNSPVYDGAQCAQQGRSLYGAFTQ